MRWDVFAKMSADPNKEHDILVRVWQHMYMDMDMEWITECYGMMETLHSFYTQTDMVLPAGPIHCVAAANLDSQDTINFLLVLSTACFAQTFFQPPTERSVKVIYSLYWFALLYEEQLKLPNDSSYPSMFPSSQHIGCTLTRVQVSA